MRWQSGITAGRLHGRPRNAGSARRRRGPRRICPPVSKGDERDGPRHDRTGAARRRRPAARMVGRRDARARASFSTTWARRPVGKSLHRSSWLVSPRFRAGARPGSAHPHDPAEIGLGASWRSTWPRDHLTSRLVIAAHEMGPDREQRHPFRCSALHVSLTAPASTVARGTLT